MREATPMIPAFFSRLAEPEKYNYNDVRDG
jgi:hypothetical protein